jgi:hypothetical protein
MCKLSYIFLSRHYARSRKVAGSIPEEVNFFNVPNPSVRTRPWGSLGLEQKLVPEAENNVSGE